MYRARVEKKAYIRYKEEKKYELMTSKQTNKKKQGLLIKKIISHTNTHVSIATATIL